MGKTDGRAVFLDRDGTLIQDVGYPRDPRQVRLLPGAVPALASLKERGFSLVLVSNQSGIGRGLVTSEEAGRIHARLVSCLAECGVQLDAAYYCPHAPEECCPCRKPSPAMLLRAAERLGLAPARSFMVGDKASDVEAGKRAGCRAILLAEQPLPCDFDPPADGVATCWPEVLGHVLRLEQTPA
jgi:histidinol-phosphate phosphatase family protein